MTTYNQLTVRPIINATCHWTDYGGAVMWPEVMNAMTGARNHYVNLHELLDKAGCAISHYTHAEATHIVSGCSAGLLVGAAAIMTRADRVKMAMLPHPTNDMKNEFVAFRCPRKTDDLGRAYPNWTYAHAVRSAGGTIIEVGDNNGVTAEEIEKAFGPRTAGVYWISDEPAARITLKKVIAVAHRHDLPILVDASNTLPPSKNLHSIIDAGADLVAFSGGKGLRGPQGSGFVTGRSDLIYAARQQSFPFDGVGRSLKVSKEEIVGLVTAIEIWNQRDHDQDMHDAHRRTQHVVNHLADLPHCQVEYRFPDHIGRPYPTVFLHLSPDQGRTASEVIAEMLTGDPPIALMDFNDPWVVRVDVRILEDDEVETVATRLREVLS